MKALVEKIINRNIFITGSAKNAGKTTLLNFLLRNLRPKTEVLITSVGIDGEARDLVFGHPKPLIKVEEGDFVLTTDSAIKASCAICKIKEVFQANTVLGKLVFAEILRGDYIELIGAETNSQLNQILETIEVRYGKKTVLIDGAVNRVTQAGIRPKAGVIDVIKVTPTNLAASMERLKFMAWVLSNYKNHWRKKPPSITNLNSYYIDGALTLSKFKAIPESTETLILNDYPSIFIDLIHLNRAKFQIVFRNLIKIYGIVLICQGINEDDFFTSVEKLNINNILFKNPYKEYLK